MLSACMPASAPRKPTGLLNVADNIKGQYEKFI